MSEHKILHARGLGAPTIVTERDAARYLAVSVYALRVWRREGCGPEFARMGRMIRYRVAALDAFLAAHTIHTSPVVTER